MSVASRLTGRTLDYALFASHQESVDKLITSSCVRLLSLVHNVTFLVVLGMAVSVSIGP